MTVSTEITAAPPYAPAVIALCAEQQEELERRYDGDDEAPSGLDPQISFLLARIEGEPVGCAGLQLLEPGVGEVRRMYVRPAHRGHGVSRMLLTAVERLARDRAVHTLRLETGNLQPEAIGLYQSTGYRRIPVFGPYLGSVHSLCFEKHLHLRAAAPDGTRSSLRGGPDLSRGDLRTGELRRGELGGGELRGTELRGADR